MDTEPQMTLNELKLLKEVIDISSQKNAFSPDQFYVIGALYKKLTTVIDHHDNKSEPVK